LQLASKFNVGPISYKIFNFWGLCNPDPRWGFAAGPHWGLLLNLAYHFQKCSAMPDPTTDRLKRPCQLSSKIFLNRWNKRNKWQQVTEVHSDTGH